MSENSGSSLLRWKTDYPYFRKVRRRAVLILVASIIIPLLVLAEVVISGRYSTINGQAGPTLSETAAALKGKIDLYLKGQLDLVMMAAASLEPMDRREDGDIGRELVRLKSTGLFHDLAIYDRQGRRIAGSGLSAGVAGAETLTAQQIESIDRDCAFGEMTTDSHGSIMYYTAWCPIGGGQSHVLRAVFRPGPLPELMTGHDSGTTEAYLAGRAGVIGNTRSASQRSPDSSPGQKTGGRDSYLEVSLRLETAPWQCLVRQPMESGSPDLKRTGSPGLLIPVSFLALAVITAILTVNHLVGKMEDDHRLIKSLERQIKRAGQLANSVHLSHGPVHELKNVMVNADSTAVCLKEALGRLDTQQPEIADCLRKIEEELRRGQVMVDRLHDNIRIPALESIIGQLDLNRLLTELIDLLGLELYLNGIMVETSFQDDLPPISGDRVQIRQVFMNILLNAISAVGSNGTVTVATSCEDDSVTVTVIDDGPGIPEEHTDRIFDPLFTTKKGNSGMGLSICASILETLGGRIEARNEPGRGASFTVRLFRRMK